MATQRRRTYRKPVLTTTVPGKGGRPGSILDYARVLLATGQIEAALGWLNEIMQQPHPGSKALVLRAQALLEMGQAHKALQDLSQVAEELQDGDYLLLLARAQLLSGCDDRTLGNTFLEGLRRFPEDDRIHLTYIQHVASNRALDPQAGRLAQERLRALLQRSVRLSPQLQAQALFLLAELSAEQVADLGEAEDLYHQGLGLDADNPVGLAGLGSLLLRQGRAAHALPWLLRSLMVDPQGNHTLNLVAQALPMIFDDEALARWLALLLSGMSQAAPNLLARLMRLVQEQGRTSAYEDVRRQAHRMKNKVAVLASRSNLNQVQDVTKSLEQLYEEWSRFLQTMRNRSGAPRLLSVSKLVQQSIDQAVSQPGRLDCQLPEGLPLVTGDEEPLVDAIANILTNAFQASPSNRPVRVEVRTRDPRFVEVAISDEGPGISPQMRKSIFEMGYTTKNQGSGVGLAVAQRAITTHGGQLLLSSGPGGPTIFTIRLPACRPTDALLHSLSLSSQLAP